MKIIVITVVPLLVVQQKSFCQQTSAPGRMVVVLGGLPRIVAAAVYFMVEPQPTAPAGRCRPLRCVLQQATSIVSVDSTLMDRESTPTPPVRQHVAGNAVLALGGVMLASFSPAKYARMEAALELTRVKEQPSHGWLIVAKEGIMLVGVWGIFTEMLGT